MPRKIMFLMYLVLAIIYFLLGMLYLGISSIKYGQQGRDAALIGALFLVLAGFFAYGATKNRRAPSDVKSISEFEAWRQLDHQQCEEYRRGLVIPYKEDLELKPFKSNIFG